MKFGDVVLFKGNDLESKTIGFFLEKRGYPSPYIHSALRTRKYKAESIGLRGFQVYDLKSPSEWYDEFVILKHKAITSSKRRKLKKLNKDFSKHYDLWLIMKLGINSFFPQNSDLDDLSTENKFICSSRIALMYGYLEMPIIERVHLSQITPQHFIDGGNFEIIDEWKRFR